MLRVGKSEDAQLRRREVQRVAGAADDRRHLRCPDL